MRTLKVRKARFHLEAVEGRLALSTAVLAVVPSVPPIGLPADYAALKESLVSPTMPVPGVTGSNLYPGVM
jgi:hypothetical protein